jgi:hypothetical protein
MNIKSIHKKCIYLYFYNIKNRFTGDDLSSYPILKKINNFLKESAIKYLPDSVKIENNNNNNNNNNKEINK